MTEQFDKALLARLINRPLTENEDAGVTVWQKQRNLSHLSVQPGFDVIVEMLGDYALKEVHALVSCDLASREDIIAHHAAAFAATRIYNNFLEDVSRAVEESRKTPEILAQQLRVNKEPSTDILAG